MSYQDPVQESGPSKMVIGGVACATTLLVAAATFALTAPAHGRIVVMWPARPV